MVFMWRHRCEARQWNVQAELLLLIATSLLAPAPALLVSRRGRMGLGGSETTANISVSNVSACTAAATQALAVQQWPALPAFDTATNDVDNLTLLLAEEESALDTWQRHCIELAEAAEALLTPARHQLAIAGSQKDRFLAYKTKFSVGAEEQHTKLGNIQTQCWNQKQLCEHFLESSNSENHSMQTSKGLMTKVTNAVGNVSGLGDVKDALANQTGHEQRFDDAVSDHCVSQMVMLDWQVETAADSIHVLEAKLKAIAADLDVASAFYQAALDAVASLEQIQAEQATRCQLEINNLSAWGQALRERRTELLGGAAAAHVVDCEVSGWHHTGSSCSSTCGGGTLELYREVVRKPSGGGTACPGLLAANITCNPEPCPVDCNVTSWSEWSSCSSPCSAGIRTRSRSILHDPLGSGAPCGDVTEVENCSNPTSCNRGCSTV